MDNSNYCFVIQPITEKKYKKRYEDVYVPAVKAAGLTPYRVDLDPIQAVCYSLNPWPEAL